MYSRLREYINRMELLEAENKALRLNVQSLETTIQALKTTNEKLGTAVASPSCRSQVIDALQSGLKTTSAIRKKVNASQSAVRCAVYDLYEFGILTRTGPHSCEGSRGGVEYHYFLKGDKR